MTLSHNIFQGAARPALAFALATLMATPARPDSALQISVVEGREARYSAGSAVTTPVAVRVERNGKPVSGARVRFSLPEFGPGGRFADGTYDAVAFSDESGMAYMSAFRTNPIPGRYTLVVDANQGGQTGAAAIPQMNVTSLNKAIDAPSSRDRASVKQGSRASSKLLLAVGVGAAVALGGAFASRGSRSGGGTPTTVSVGGVGVGGGN